MARTLDSALAATVLICSGVFACQVVDEAEPDESTESDAGRRESRDESKRTEDSGAADDSASEDSKDDASRAGGDAGDTSKPDSESVDAGAGGAEGDAGTTTERDSGVGDDATDDDLNPGESEEGGAVTDADAGEAVDGVAEESIGAVGERREDLLGPTATDQQPIVLDEATAYPLHDGDGTYIASSGFEVAANGDLYVAFWQAGGFNNGMYVSMFDAELTEQRRFEYTGPTSSGDLQLEVFAIDSGGNVYTGGTPAPHTAGVQKLDPDGVLLWEDEWSTNSPTELTAMTVLEDDSLVVQVHTLGQAPGNPPETAGGPVFARYEADGTRSWLKQQSGEIGLGGFDRVWTSMGEIFAIDQARTIRRLDAAGDTVWMRELPRPVASVAPHEDSFFTWNRVDRGAQAFLPMINTPLLAQIGVDGDERWFRTGQTDRAEEIDEVEGIIWHGAFDMPAERAIAVSDEGVFVAGYYRNAYQYGATPPTSTQPFFVARYDHTGERLWFQELIPPGTFETYSLGFQIVGLKLNADGDPVVAFNARGPNGVFSLVRFDASDGSIH